MSGADAVARIAEKLVKEALWDGERATWLGDDILESGTTVYRAVGGDLYGGTAGIGAFLARYAAVSGDTEAARAARGALLHAAAWVERTRPDGALMSGAAGVAVAALDGARLLGDDQLAGHALRLTRTTVRRIPAAVDLICGRAGTLLALLHLAQGLGGPERELAARTADTVARSLIGDAQPGPVLGSCWPSDIAQDGPPLCGLAHGASGVALALLEWGAPEAAADAAAFERAWFSPEQGNWPDLRDGVGWPVFWCHGALGVGVARLRHYDLTGGQVFAAEAGVAVDAVVGALDAMTVQDLSICHGLAGAVEFLLDAARIFGQPALRTTAVRAMERATDLVGEGEWPCGVQGGGENPSLFLGLAGIGSALLRTVDGRTPSTVLTYAEGAMSARVIVQLSGDQDNVRDTAESVGRLVPGARVERLSPRGRVLLRLPADADVDAALAALNGADGVDYAELDVTDTAQG